MSRQNAQKWIGKDCCPDCGAMIPSYPRYTPWCEECNWNIQPDNVKPSSWWQQAISQRLAQRLFDQMSHEMTAKQLTGTHLTALLLATIIYLIHIIFLFWGSYLIWSWTIGRILAGILIIYLTIRALNIRYDELPPAMMLADEKQFPALNHFIGDVARRLAVPKPKIALSEQFTATFARVGSARESLLCIGIPFLALLSGGEMLSLIGHELSHDHDGAWSRSLYVQNARTAVESWYKLFSFYHWRTHSNDMIVFCGLLFAFICLPVSIVVGGLLRLLELLIFHDSQRAEYVADLQSLAVAGNHDAPHLLRKSYYRYLGALQEAYQKAPLHQKYTVVQRKLQEIPAREKERVWRIAQMQQPKLNSSHPTVTQRIALLKNRPPIPPAFVINPEQFAAIQAELAAWPQIIHGHEMAYLREVKRETTLHVGELSAVSAD